MIVFAAQTSSEPSKLKPEKLFLRSDLSGKQRTKAEMELPSMLTKPNSNHRKESVVYVEASAALLL